jgi:hypothetical protein
MQTLDSFISPILGFEGDIPILAIPVLTRSPSGESAIDPLAGASARALKTLTGKWKAAAYPIPQKKTRKATWKSSSAIKINEPAPQGFSCSDSIRFSAEHPNPPIKKVYLS